MQTILVTHKIFHNDDFKISLEYAEENLAKYTDLSEEDVKERFRLMARTLFHNILPKDRRMFRIDQDPETGDFDIVVFKRQPEDTQNGTSNV